MSTDTRLVDREALVRAILIGSEETLSRRPDDRFEWYASAEEMADAILAGLDAKPEKPAIDVVGMVERGAWDEFTSESAK